MIKKVLFYTNALRVFRTTHIGHLYEICQKYPTILLSEKLDSETEKIIHDKRLFPKLEKIIFVDQRPGQRRPFLAEIKKNGELHKLAKEVVENYRPDVLITPTDIHSLFEMYLFRFAKRIGALKIVIQPSNVATSAETKKWVDYVNAYEKYPKFLPLWSKLFLVNLRKELGHFFYLIFLPLLIGEMPFSRKASYLLRTGNIGMGGSDYVSVFSQFFYNILKKEISEEKLYILGHPLARETRRFFEKVFFNKSKKEKKSGNVALLLLPNVEIGFRRKDYSLIRKEERNKKWEEIAILTSRNLPDWKIIVKPHPDLKDLNKIKNLFISSKGSIEIVNPKEQVDKFIEIADIIIGLPLSSSSALFTASLQCPGKPILSLDLLHEVIGDYYQNFDGIEYIDNEEKLSATLKLIKNNKYSAKAAQKEKKPKEFQNTVELLEYLYKKKNS